MNLFKKEFGKSSYDVQRKFLIIKNIVVIYNLIIFIVALLRKYYVLKPTEHIYLIWLYTGIIWFIVIILFTLIEKSGLTKIMASSITLITISLLLTTWVAFVLNGRADLIRFSKNATKVEAYIYDIKKDIVFHKDICPGRIRYLDRCHSVNDDNKWIRANDYYQLVHIYYLRYTVNGKDYESQYEDKIYKKFSSKEYAMNYKQKYNAGDHMTIYYNNDSPTEIRKNIATNYDLLIYYIEIAVILVNTFVFNKYNKLVENEFSK